MNEIIRPGGMEMTGQAIEACQLRDKAKVLDIGCGRGQTAAFLTQKYGLEVTGLDISSSLLTEARAAYPDLQFVSGTGEALDFPSKTFDCVLLECTLSLIPNPVEAIHEAFCVLKDGGYLIISDLYLPDPSFADRAAIAAIKKHKLEKEHKGGECETEIRRSDCTIDGALILDELIAALNDLQFQKVLFEDRKSDLDSFVMSLIFQHGSLENYSQQQMQDSNGDPTGISCMALSGKSTPSYFLLVARKGGSQ